MQKSFQRYIRHHRAQNSSDKTIKYHRDSIERSLMSFLAGRGHSLNVEDLTLDDVQDWIDDQRERGLAQKTIRTRVVSVKAFTRWLVEEEWLDRDPLRKLKLPRVDDVAKDTLDPDEVDRLLKACDRGTLLGVRDFAIVLLLYSTGLRASELANLGVADLDWERGQILVRKGKGGKFRVLPMGPKVEKALDRYLSHRDRQEHAHLFLNRHGQPLPYRGLVSVLTRLERKTGVHANPHKWRHSSAVQYLRAGGKVEALKAMLGHTTLQMTLHYARIAGVDLSAAHELADPTRSLKTRV